VFQYNSGYRKYQPFRDKAFLCQEVVKQIAMNPAIAIFKWVDKDEAKSDDRGQEYRIKFILV
jgi:hypothetical protein